MSLSEDEHRVLQRFAQVEAKPSALTRNAVDELCQLVGGLPDGQLAHHFEERLKSLEALFERLQRDKRGPREPRWADSQVAVDRGVAAPERLQKRSDGSKKRWAFASLILRLAHAEVAHTRVPRDLSQPCERPNCLTFARRLGTASAALRRALLQRVPDGVTPNRRRSRDQRSAHGLRDDRPPRVRNLALSLGSTLGPPEMPSVAANRQCGCRVR